MFRNDIGKFSGWIVSRTLITVASHLSMIIIFAIQEASHIRTT